jgi:hypothetical protein
MNYGVHWHQQDKVRIIHRFADGAKWSLETLWMLNKLGLSNQVRGEEVAE